MSQPRAILLLAQQITPAIRAALNLPDNTWQLAINRNLTLASYMDRKYRDHHLDLDELKAHALRRVLFVLA